MDNTLSILMFLKENRPAIKTEIYNKVSGSASLQSKLDKLQDMGLIQMYSSDTNVKIYVVLTDKGERVVRLIDEMIGVRIELSFHRIGCSLSSEE